MAIANPSDVVISADPAASSGIRSPSTAGGEASTKLPFRIWQTNDGPTVVVPANHVDHHADKPETSTSKVNDA
mgnify:FL=1